ncbi:MAG TPA: methanogenesis marker protein Mmp4/MtxX [Methanoregulaceae archaeon]|nr:MAG: methanogenesis marker protein Mmp4/MtxX [Methanolinea sp.]HON81424.1 methanogenesis marker protein Mmp4/MtxX [Methanoregulaceae archaeon]HPD10048.1 methanogenesis marker protein Mmp4/MtxX [Methanoregulaceae archaeon]HRT15054.1 methanogenesis marker protein Mmp4/MtxX [Methanoregulaceae archaeon]HRU30625.1 methanogenesis marker protein Mmp4/MtxX [Methanoregulaceae archaeon]
MRTIGIGIAGDAEKVIRSIAGSLSGVALFAYIQDDTITLPPRSGIRIRTCKDPAGTLVADLVDGRIDAGVRGTLPANETLSALKAACGVQRLERAALLETAGGARFFLAPVGVDEGWEIGERIELARKAQAMAVRFGLPERIGVLSGGRSGDIGRHPAVDRSLADAELIARMTGGVHYQILIEDAVRDCGVIIAPDGISGNLIFRTLIFLGSGRGHGAPVLNIGKIFVDTSRATPDYANAIRLAYMLSK